MVYTHLTSPIDRQDFRYDMILKIPKIQKVYHLYYVDLHLFILVHKDVSIYSPYSKVITKNIILYLMNGLGGGLAYSN